MKTSVVVTLVTLALSPFALAQTTPEEAVLQAERELCQAYQKSDVAGITRGVMEDYTLTNSHGKISGRADDLAEASKGDPKYETFANRDMKVRVHGDAAVVLGITRTMGVSGGKPFDAEFQFTDTFIKDGGQWRLLAGHVSKVPDAAKP